MGSKISFLACPNLFMNKGGSRISNRRGVISPQAGAWPHRPLPNLKAGWECCINMFQIMIVYIFTINFKYDFNSTLHLKPIYNILIKKSYSIFFLFHFFFFLFFSFFSFFLGGGVGVRGVGVGGWGGGVGWGGGWVGWGGGGGGGYSESALDELMP